MASQSITNLAKAAESARRTAANMRRRAKEKEQYMLSQGEAVVGGAAGGLLDATFGEGGTAELFGLPMAAVVGSVFTLIGFSDLPGAEHAGHTGSGMLAYGVGNLVRDGFSSE